MDTTELKKIASILNSPRSIPHYLLCFLDSKIRDTVRIDLEKWCGAKDANYFENSFYLRLNWFLWDCPEFRNLLYYRLSRQTTTTRSVICKAVFLPLLKILYKPLPTLEISSKSIGPGLVIQHGYATMIGGNLGSNCKISARVTVGHIGSGAPTIGNNVSITTGAVIVGNVSIGDNCTIGANSLVTGNIPPDCVVVGVPARIIFRKSKMDNPGAERNRTN
jgi:serine O-acetyltransferase